MSQTVTLNALARRCRVSSMLLVRFFPAAWTSPRDWWMNGPEVMISAWSLRALAIELEAGGHLDVANVVRDVRGELIPEVSRLAEVCA